MTNTTLTTRTNARVVRPSSVRRIGSLARAEALLLRRNPMALINALATPVMLAAFFGASQPSDGRDGVGGGPSIVTALAAVSLLSVIFMNLVTALVARREELVLKRLRTGELHDAEIIAGTAVPGVALAWGQVIVGILVALTAFHMSAPTNPVLILAAITLGTAVFVLLAALTTVITRTVELAQVTAAPGYAIPLLLSGLFPLDSLPGPLQRLAQVSPLTPVVDLMRLGLTGTTRTGATVGLAGSFGAAVIPVLVLAAYIVVGVWAVRRWFRWDPRR
jgi:ABC-2 type transport system permease protein